MIFVVLILAAIGWFYIVFHFLPKLFLKKVEKKFIIPYIENKGFSYVKTIKIPFSIPKNKGDFNTEIIINPFYDTRHNEKKYYYVFYKNKEGDTLRITMKLCHNFMGLPKAVEFYPEI